MVVVVLPLSDVVIVRTEFDPLIEMDVDVDFECDLDFAPDLAADLALDLMMVRLFPFDEFDLLLYITLPSES